MLNAVVFEWLELLTRRALLSFYPRFSMRLAFERWHMRVAIRRKEESLKRGHVKLQIELDEVRGQRAALADTSAELQRAQLQLTTQAAEHARELERVRQSRYVCAPRGAEVTRNAPVRGSNLLASNNLLSLTAACSVAFYRSDEVTKAEKQVEVMFGKLQKLHERMQQVREVEDTAFKAASSRGEVMIKVRVPFCLFAAFDGCEANRYLARIAASPRTWVHWRLNFKAQCSRQATFESTS